MILSARCPFHPCGDCDGRTPAARAAPGETTPHVPRDCPLLADRNAPDPEPRSA